MTRVDQRGMRIEHATRGGFGPQNLDGGSDEERTRRGNIEEFASKRSYLVKGAVAVGWKICRVELECPRS